MQLAPLATWVKCHNASKRSVFISSSAKFHLIENYPAGSGTIASPALIFSKEVPTTRCRFFFKRLFQKIRVENKFIRDKVQMVKNAMPGRRLSLFFIFGWRHREKSCEASKFSSRDSSDYKTVQSYTSKCYNFELDSFLEIGSKHLLSVLTCSSKSRERVHLKCAEMTFISVILLPSLIFVFIYEKYCKMIKLISYD